MLKKIMTTLALSLAVAQSASAYTIHASSEKGTFYGHRDSIGAEPTVSAAFGKFLTSDEYGIMVTVKYFDEGSSRGTRTGKAFFKLDDATLVKEGKNLYLVMGEHSQLVATKKMMNWKLVEGVKLHSWMTQSGSSITVDAALEIIE